MWSLADIKAMNAAEARKKTKAVIHDAKTAFPSKAMMDAAYRQIHERIRGGHYSTDGVLFSGLRLYVSAADRKAVYAELKQQGYTIRGGVVYWNKP